KNSGPEHGTMISTSPSGRDAGGGVVVVFVLRHESNSRSATRLNSAFLIVIVNESTPKSLPDARDTKHP
ncbi:MAG: hypothetical protein AB7O48_17595, partial [Cyclobacteriaceae bacterium]